MTGRGVLPGWLALAVGALLAGSGCRSGEENPTATEGGSRAPNEGMRGVSLQNIREGDTRWVLQADSASVFREKKRIEAENVQVDFYEKDEHVSTLTAEKGILLQASDDLEARGNVRVRSDDGALLRTQVLYWDHQGAKIHTDRYVEITKEDNVLRGVGLEADPGLDRVRILEEARGTLRSPPEEVLGKSEAGGL